MPGFDGLLVNHGALDQAAADCAQGVRNIEARMDRLASELAPLSSEWSGQAQATYVECKARWDAAIAEMAALLAQTSTAVTQSNSDYIRADIAGANQFGG